MVASRKLATLALAFAILTPPLAAETWTFTLDPAATEVRFTLGATLHVVSGSLRAREGRIVLDPETGEASGRIVLDATSAETGNRRRDDKMHEKILESARSSSSPPPRPTRAASAPAATSGSPTRNGGWRTRASWCCGWPTRWASRSTPSAAWRSIRPARRTDRHPSAAAELSESVKKSLAAPNCRQGVEGKARPAPT